MAVAWYVIYTKPQKEKQVTKYLEAQGIDVFYPCIRVKPVNPRSSTIRPYFPRYIFVHVDMDEIGTSVLQWVPQAVGLVQFGGQAATVPDHFVYELKKQIAELSEISKAKLDNFKQGDVVKIKDGPFAGYEALFDMRLNGSMRAQVLLEVLGQLVKVQVDGDTIDKY